MARSATLPARARVDAQERGRSARDTRGTSGPLAAARLAAAKRAEPLWRAYERARRRAQAAGDPTRTGEARNRLVEHYQPLVRTIIAALERRLPRCVERGDLETAANVGLMGAVEAFDAARGVPFELYAEHRLRGALLDELRNQDWLPRPWRARLEARRRAIERLRAGLGREPCDEEVAVALGIAVQEYHQDYGPALVDGPVSDSWGDDGLQAGASALEGVPDTGREAPEERLTRDELLRLVAQKLSVQEYRLVYLKYWEDMPLREIGQVLGLSESRVCKIHLALLDRLRDKLGADANAR
ncbi:MAG: sigma-70 family RNA polymerase sigma factor [Planctomycetes bacterium]|nr:sigma-70 family RNA polymerase sigma factor [Planctomycetota bacterium]